MQSSVYTPQGRLDVNGQLRLHAPLVRRLAHQMMARVPANVEIDDLIQAGMIGLSDALTRFDVAQGAEFEAFASQRIRGAMLDELRAGDWMSRGDRRLQREIVEATRRVEQRLGHTPRDREVAAELGLELAEYQERVRRVCTIGVVHLEDLAGAPSEDTAWLDHHVVDEEPGPAALLQDRRMREALVEAIRELPEREQQVMSLYYEHDMNLKEIGAVLGVTESRVSQIHSQVIAQLREQLRDW